MPAAALATVASLEQILFGKYPVSFFGKVKITFFKGDNLLHNNGLNAKNALLKNTIIKAIMLMFFHRHQVNRYAFSERIHRNIGILSF